MLTLNMEVFSRLFEQQGNFQYSSKIESLSSSYKFNTTFKYKKWNLNYGMHSIHYKK